MTIVSPRSNNYERLEGGLGPTKSTVKRFGWLGWKRLAILVVGVLTLFWVFRPRQDHYYGPWTPSSNPQSTTSHTLSSPTSAKSTLDHTPPPVHDDDVVSSRPTSFATDPDPSKTVYCTSPSKPSLPLIQYALMIDAGSTGSRIHVYKFNNCGPSPTYEYELFKMTQPGLSSFSGRPQDAAQSLDVLMDEAVKVVPESLRKCTPVAVKATAGLRLLGAEQSGAILQAVERRLKERYPFEVQEKDGVVIMDGKDEGVYAWITANYMLNAIRGADSPAHTSSSSSSSWAVLDLGGASTQIVFEPSFSKPDSSLTDGEHKYDLVFSGRKYVLYQHSYLGYGLMHARKSVHRLVEFMASLRSGGSGDVIGNPCLAKGTQRIVEIAGERTEEIKNVTMGGEDIGSFQACNRVIELVLAKDAICEVKPCSFDGVYQPSLLDTFASGKVLLLSYFYDRLEPLLPKENTPPITVSTFRSMAEDVCQGKAMWTKRWGTEKVVMDELEGRPEWCLDLTFMHALLRLGYEFNDEREVKIGKRIEGTELGWALGATLSMVAGEVKCRI